MYICFLFFLHTRHTRIVKILPAPTQSYLPLLNTQECSSKLAIDPPLLNEKNWQPRGVDGHPESAVTLSRQSSRVGGHPYQLVLEASYPATEPFTPGSGASHPATGIRKRHGSTTGFAFVIIGPSQAALDPPRSPTGTCKSFRPIGGDLRVTMGDHMIHSVPTRYCKSFRPDGGDLRALTRTLPPHGDLR